MSTLPNVTLEPVVFTNPVHLSRWYGIRNERTVCYGCRSVTPITVDEHRAWWKRSAGMSTRRLYFIRVLHGDSQTVGILRLDHRGRTTEVWLAVRRQDRQKGIAAHALKQVGPILRKLRWPPLSAVVSSHKNLASWRLFTRAGFVMQKPGFVQLVQGRTS
jgi:RimJ/RimL family protein N-acetyltransferase